MGKPDGTFRSVERQSLRSNSMGWGQGCVFQAFGSMRNSFLQNTVICNLQLHLRKVQSYCSDQVSGQSTMIPWCLLLLPMQTMHYPIMGEIFCSQQIEMQDEVTSIVRSVLGTAPASSQPLMEAGLDSLGAVELKNALSSRFSLPDLPASLIFDYTTIEALSKFLTGEFVDSVSWKYWQILPARSSPMRMWQRSAKYWASTKSVNKLASAPLMSSVLFARHIGSESSNTTEFVNLLSTALKPVTRCLKYLVTAALNLLIIKIFAQKNDVIWIDVLIRMTLNEYLFFR